MKGPLSAENLFFISAASFAVSFVLYWALGYLWPFPEIAPEVLEQLPPDPFMDPFSPAGILNQVSWILGIAGIVTFILGFLAGKR